MTIGFVAIIFALLHVVVFCLLLFVVGLFWIGCGGFLCWFELDVGVEFGWWFLWFGYGLGIGGM